MTRLSILAAVAALTTLACDDEAAINKPHVSSAEAVCRLVEGTYKLDRVSVLVQDLDGVADLTDPVAVVEATRLPMEANPSASEPVDPDSGEAVGCDGADGCVLEYVWRQTNDSEQIYCGEEGTSLEVMFEVADVAGFWARVVFISQPL